MHAVVNDARYSRAVQAATSTSQMAVLAVHAATASLVAQNWETRMNAAVGEAAAARLKAGLRSVGEEMERETLDLAQPLGHDCAIPIQARLHIHSNEAKTQRMIQTRWPADACRNCCAIQDLKELVVLDQELSLGRDIQDEDGLGGHSADLDVHET